MEPTIDHTTTNVQTTTTPSAQEHLAGPPPPYSEADSEIDDDSDMDGCYAQPDVKLSINAKQTVKGSHNLVPINGTHLTHAARLSAILVTALNRAANGDAKPDGVPRARRRLNIHVNIDCSVNVVGDRNIMGNFGVNHKPNTLPVRCNGSQPILPGDVSGGAKRKATEDAEEMPVKRMAVARE